jgi:hypothetical protein
MAELTDPIVDTLPLDEQMALTNHADLYVYEDGLHYIMKSDRLEITGDYLTCDNKKAFTIEITVTGSLIGGHTLKASVPDKQVTWDGTPIFVGSDDYFSDSASGVSVTRKLENIQTWANLQGVHIPPDVKTGFPPGKLAIYHAYLPDGIEMEVAHKVVDFSEHGGEEVCAFMEYLLIMPPEPGGQTGNCGNFNGDSSDDTVLGHLVTTVDNRLLTGAMAGQGGCAAVPEAVAGQAGCDAAALTKAKEWCDALNGGNVENQPGVLAKVAVQACYFDACISASELNLQLVAVGDAWIKWEVQSILQGAAPAASAPNAPAPTPVPHASGV